jgi:hypothetical protein
MRRWMRTREEDDDDDGGSCAMVPMFPTTAPTARL